jgi:ketosteroid isomerase-like protein
LQPAAKTKKGKKISKKAKQVLEACEQFRNALIDSDVKALERLLSEDLCYGHSDGLTEGKASFIENIAQGRYDFTSIIIRDQRIRLFGKTAIVRHAIDADTNDNNIPGQINLKLVLVWRREKCDWRLIERQSVRA